MLNFISLFCFIFSFGVLFHIRGGWAPFSWLKFSGDIPVRLIWAVGTSLITTLAVFKWEFGILIPLMFISCLVPWFSSLALKVWSDWLKLMVRGPLWIILALPIFYFLDYNYYWLFLTVLCPFCYWIAYKIPSTIPSFQSGPALGEPIFGGLIGLSFWLTLFIPVDFMNPYLYHGVFIINIINVL